MRHSSGHILYVEDHEDTSQIVSLMMRTWGYEVRAVPTLAEGLQLAKSENFDVLLLDHRLPDGTGIELCKRIREFDILTPIIFHSASAQPAQRDEAMAAGAQAYIVKPADFVELELTIADMMRKGCADERKVSGLLSQ